MIPNDLVNLTFQEIQTVLFQGGAMDFETQFQWWKQLRKRIISKFRILIWISDTYTSTRLTEHLFITMGTYVLVQRADYTASHREHQHWCAWQEHWISLLHLLTWILQGGLYVSAELSRWCNNRKQRGIRSDQQIAVGIVPYLEVSSGLLRVYGSISFKVGSFAEPFGFRQTGGDILVNCGSTGVSTEKYFILPTCSELFSTMSKEQLPSSKKQYHRSIYQVDFLFSVETQVQWM